MKQVAVILVLILAGIVILNTTKPKDVMHTTEKEEGAGDLIGQEALKHL